MIRGHSCHGALPDRSVDWPELSALLCGGTYLPAQYSSVFPGIRTPLQGFARNIDSRHSILNRDSQPYRCRVQFLFVCILLNILIGNRSSDSFTGSVLSHP
jgi:hypothetical protein